MAEAELPAPAGPPSSPPLTTEPAGDVESVLGLLDTYSGSSLASCRDPLAEDPLADGAQVAVLCGRARQIELFDTRAKRHVGTEPAGIGPTGMVTDGKDAAYVVDALGEALLVYRRVPLQLIRRVHLGGGPYAIAFDRERWGLWITLNGTNQLVFYKAGWRPALKETYPSIRNARSIAVSDAGVVVTGLDGVQTLRPRTK